LSRELADLLVELSIAMHKHAIYPPGHPLLDGAVDAVARKLWSLLVDRPALSIGVARKQLIIEGVATDPNNPLLQELAQKFHRHQIGAVKFMRGLERRELAETLAMVAIDAARIERPLGQSTDELAKRWDHVRVFSLTYDRLELLDDESDKPNKMASGRAAQLWVGLARAALAADATGDDDATPLEPMVIAKAIDEHQREQAYDQVVVGYMLQIANELKTGSGTTSPSETEALQSRISRMVGALRPETLTRLLEMGGDAAQRNRFVLDATQGMGVEAVVDLVKAAAAAGKQTVSHSMIRMLSKLAKHAGSDVTSRRADADRGLRETVTRIVGEWSLQDPNPDAYRAVLEQVSRSTALGTGALGDDLLLECEPERIVEMALEIGVVGGTLWRAVDRLEREERIGLLLDLIDGAPRRTVAAEILQHLALKDTLRRMLSADRIDFAAAARLVKHEGAGAVPTLLEAAAEMGDPKTRQRMYDLVAASGGVAASLVARRLEEVAPDGQKGGANATVQRELLALIGRLRASDETALPADVDLGRYLRHSDPHIRREALKLLLHGPQRDAALLAALGDADERIVYVALTAAHEQCPAEGVAIIRRRIERGADDLDAPLRALGVRAVATVRTPETLKWLIGRVLTRSKLFGRPKLQSTTPETLAALTAIVAGWRQDPATATVLELAAKSRDVSVRAAVKGV